MPRSRTLTKFISQQLLIVMAVLLGSEAGSATFNASPTYLISYDLALSYPPENCQANGQAQFDDKLESLLKCGSNRVLVRLQLLKDDWIAVVVAPQRFHNNEWMASFSSVTRVQVSQSSSVEYRSKRDEALHLTFVINNAEGR